MLCVVGHETMRLREAGDEIQRQVFPKSGRFW